MIDVARYVLLGFAVPTAFYFALRGCVWAAHALMDRFDTE